MCKRHEGRKRWDEAKKIKMRWDEAKKKKMKSAKSVRVRARDLQLSQKLMTCKKSNGIVLKVLKVLKVPKF